MLAKGKGGKGTKKDGVLSWLGNGRGNVFLAFARVFWLYVRGIGSWWGRQFLLHGWSVGSRMVAVVGVVVRLEALFPFFVLVF